MLESEGYYVMLYTSDIPLTTLRNVSSEHKEVFGLDTWIARYYTESAVNFNDKPMLSNLNNNSICGMRQYSQNCKIDGYGKNSSVDVDLAYHNYPALLYKLGLNKLDELHNDKTNQKKMN